MTTARAYLRMSIPAVMLLACALFIHLRGQIERIPQSEDLDRLSLQVNGWSGHKLAISDDVRTVLGAGNFLSRVYWQPSNPTEGVGLFIAYFASQRTGDTMHSPRNCLPGAGWVFTEARRIEIGGSTAKPILANEYVIAKGNEKQLVLYWYQAHGRTVASEYWAKFYLVADAIRMNRTDGALVRITTPFRPGEAISDVRQRAIAFAAQLTPELDRFIPL